MQLNNIIQNLEMRDAPDPDALPDLKAEWLEQLAKAKCSARDLEKINLPPQELILGDWLKEMDIGFIFAPRGIGRTWLALHLARRIAEGGSAGPWKVHNPCRVLYVDGEMPFDEIRQRNAALAAAETDGLQYLQHEALFHFTERVLDLANPIVQDAILELCKKDQIKVLILDNLSCLFRGVSENDADSWEKVLPWLLALRRARITVIFVAHAGRNGFMRGTSRREDAADWIMSLEEANDAAETERGARFIARFVKNRHSPGESCPTLEWRFTKAGEDGRVEVSWKELSPTLVFRQCVQDGLTSATDIAEEMGISKASACRLAAKGMKEGWLKKDGRDYILAGQT